MITDMETCSWCTEEVEDRTLVELYDGARVCESCAETLVVTTVADGRVAFRRSPTIAHCDRCNFASALTECLCDHWHDCVDGPYHPECDATDEEF